MKRAVVTGCTGMLGTALIEKLLEESFEVIAVARPGSSRLSNIPQSENVTVVELSMENISNLPEILSGLSVDKCDLFFHFAWDGTHGDSRNNMDIQLLNMKYSVDAVRVASKLKCEAFLGAGSQAEYGRVKDGTKLSGNLSCNPENGYGIGKFCAGKMTRIEAEKLGIKHVWVRILSTYGILDGAHTLPMSLIRGFYENGRASCTKGEQMWDYLYAKDAAEAFFLCATKGVHGKVYPIGSGVVKPLSYYIETIRNFIDPSMEIGFGEVDYYPGQVMYLCADIEELKNDTGFAPKYSFEEGIKETINWYKETYL